MVPIAFYVSVEMIIPSFSPLLWKHVDYIGWFLKLDQVDILTQTNLKKICYLIYILH